MAGYGTHETVNHFSRKPVNEKYLTTPTGLFPFLLHLAYEVKGMRMETFKCDICQIEKKEANHWWKGYIVCRGALADIRNESVGVMVIPWETQTFHMPFGSHKLPEPDAHLCGEQHAIEWASRNLSSRELREAVKAE